MLVQNNAMQDLILFVLIVSSACAFDSDDPSGYSDFFKTNLEECENKPLTFSNPIPKWLSGKLVSKYMYMYIYRA